MSVVLAQGADRDGCGSVAGCLGHVRYLLLNGFFPSGFHRRLDWSDFEADPRGFHLPLGYLVPGPLVLALAHVHRGDAVSGRLLRLLVTWNPQVDSDSMYPSRVKLFLLT